MCNVIDILTAEGKYDEVYKELIKNRLSIIPKIKNSSKEKLKKEFLSPNLRLVGDYLSLVDKHDLFINNFSNNYDIIDIVNAEISLKKIKINDSDCYLDKLKKEYLQVELTLLIEAYKFLNA